MTRVWRAVALLRGWAQAYDVETGELVVFSDSRGIHYTGPDAWRLAALHKVQPWPAATM